MTDKTHFNVVLIGAGRVAFHLGTALKKAGHTVVQVCNRSGPRADLLSKQLDAMPVYSVDDVTKGADAYILAVSDDAIEKVANELPAGIEPIIHTSGSTHIDVLKKISDNCGVLYPVMSFSGNDPMLFSSIPIATEGSNEVSGRMVNALAASLSDKVFTLSSGDRLYLHLASIFAANFTNHMWSLARHILQRRNISYDLMIPLIRATAERACLYNPDGTQTGPAVREDRELISAHVEILKDTPCQQQIYRAVSDSIMQQYGRDKK